MQGVPLPPRCAKCKVGILKPNAVLFGESIPRLALQRADEEARKCDLILVVGTSANVSPANAIPPTASKNGAIVVEINPEKTGLTGRVSDYFIPEKSSGLMKVVQALQAQRL
eukprot:Filipodium_phascolosomae@DN5_c0_g1_i2.p2